MQLFLVTLVLFGAATLMASPLIWRDGRLRRDRKSTRLNSSH